jgi:hypothetical protein
MLIHKEIDRCIFTALTIWDGDPYGSGAVGVDVSCQIFDEKPSLDADLISVTHQDLQNPAGIGSNCVVGRTGRRVVRGEKPLGG